MSLAVKTLKGESHEKMSFSCHLQKCEVFYISVEGMLILLLHSMLLYCIILMRNVIPIYSHLIRDSLFSKPLTVELCSTFR